MEQNKAEKLIEDLYYDWFFKEQKGYSDWSDDEIALSTNMDDINGFLEEIKKIMVMRFFKKGEQ